MFFMEVYQQIFTPEHYIEFAQSLTSIVNAANNKINEPLECPPARDSRCIVTNATLAVIYTIEQKENEYEHHIVLNVLGTGYTPNAIGMTYLIYIAFLLKIDFKQVFFARTENAVYHSVFKLTPNQQRKLNSYKIPIPSMNDTQEINDYCVKQRETLQCANIKGEEMDIFDFFFDSDDDHKNGSSPQNAIVVSCILAEYVYIEETYSDFELEEQSLQQVDGKYYDVMTLSNEKGEVKTIYFDISDFFGK